MNAPAKGGEVAERVQGIAEAVAEASGVELVLAETARAGARLIVRLTIDRPGGVTIDDCAEFSRRMAARLEVEDPIPGPYELEVSSPGLDRRLVKPADFERFREKRARIALSQPLDGRRNFEGVLRGMDGMEIAIELEDGRIVRLPLDRVDKARLVPEF